MPISRQTKIIVTGRFAKEGKQHDFTKCFWVTNGNNAMREAKQAAINHYKRIEGVTSVQVITRVYADTE